ncbi:MAG: carboxypeptidase regulatory-like domain-containing protein, partial [Planctomycetota bacterium]
MPRRLLAALCLLLALVVAVLVWPQPESMVGSGVAPDPDGAREAPEEAIGRVSTTTSTQDSENAARERIATARTQGLRGRIVDAGGAPIDRVLVCAFQKSEVAPHTLHLERQRGLRHRPITATRSDDTGTFTMAIGDEFTDRNLEVHLLADTHADGHRSLRSPEPGDWIELGDIVLLAGNTLRGIVRDALTDGPLAGAEVTVTLPRQAQCDLPGRDGGRTARTDEAGNYTIEHLPTGHCAIAAASDGHARVEWPQQHIANDTANVLDFVLPPGRTLDGVVVTRGGTAIPGAFVRAFPDEARDLGIATARTGADGSFRLGGVALGAVELDAGAEGYRSARTRIAADARGPVRIELDDQGAVAVTAVAASGEPLTEFTVIARGDRSEAGSKLSARDRLRRVGPATATAPTLVDGAYVLRDLEPGTWFVEATASGHAPTRSDAYVVQAGATTSIRIQMQRGGTVEGRVLDERGAGIANAIVKLQSPALLGGEIESALGPVLAPLGDTPTCRTRADGTFAFANVAAREHRLVVRHPSFAPRIVNGVVVADGAPVALGDLRLVRGGTVAGRALKDGEIDPNIVVQLAPIAVNDLTPGVVFEARVDRTGSFRFERVPAGRYELRAGRRLEGDPFAENADQARSKIEIDSDGTGTQ